MTLIDEVKKELDEVEINGAIYYQRVSLLEFDRIELIKILFLQLQKNSGTLTKETKRPWTQTQKSIITKETNNGR